MRHVVEQLDRLADLMADISRNIAVLPVEEQQKITKESPFNKSFDMVTLEVDQWVESLKQEAGQTLGQGAYEVTLSSCGNIDYGQDPNRSLYGVPSLTMKCETVEDCQKEVRKYIDEYELGGGNWTGGKVFHEGKQIGRISYNGRYWPGEE